MNEQIELLSPAGSPEAFKAAVAAGADAVYFGVERFNARERAENIRLADLPDLIRLASSHGVKTYLTLNIIIYDNEITEAVQVVREAVECGVSAVIVQDLGLLSVLRHFFPSLEIHASTQMTTHNSAQCLFLVGEGVEQVNLCRELSFDELKALSDLLWQNGVRPEIFIHGAFCISFSGQCYLSHFLYDKQGNRGQCVQPCRRNYSLGTVSSNAYFSPFNLKDNCLFPVAKKLIDAVPYGSFKIEGRIKGAQYVWAVTSAWREQLDIIKQGKTPLFSSDKLSKSMNRGFTAGYSTGDISKDMFATGSKDESLEFVGKVVSYSADNHCLELEPVEELSAGDCVSIRSPNGSFVCTGIIQSAIAEKSLESNSQTQLKKGNADRKIKTYLFKITGKLAARILHGGIVMRIPTVISEEELLSLTKKLESETKPMPLSINISGQIGEKLAAVFSVKQSPCNKPMVCNLESNSILQRSQKRSLDKAVLSEKLGRLGNTGYCLESIDVANLGNNLFLPPCELNEMRRKAVEKLDNVLKGDDCCTNACNSVDMSTAVDSFIFEKAAALAKSDIFCFAPDKKVVVCQNPAAAEKARCAGFLPVLEIPLFTSCTRKTYLDYLSAHIDVVPLFQAVLLECDLQDAVAFLEELAGAGDSPKTSSFRPVWCENIGLAFSASKMGFPVIAGSQLNITNTASINEFAARLNLCAFVPSLELTASQVSLLKSPVPIWYPEKTKRLLMQSRQCLIRNIPAFSYSDSQKIDAVCKKQNTDRQCILTCEKYAEIYPADGERKKLYVLKRSGFYSGIFAEFDAEKLSDFNVLKKSVAVWYSDDKS